MRSTSSYCYLIPFYSPCHSYYLPYTHIITWRRTAGNSSTEVTVGSGEGWQWALGWMTWEGYVRQKMDEGASEWAIEGEVFEAPPMLQRWFDNVLQWVYSDQTETGDSVWQSRELRELSTKTYHDTKKYGCILYVSVNCSLQISYWTHSCWGKAAVSKLYCEQLLEEWVQSLVT